MQSSIRRFIAAVLFLLSACAMQSTALAADCSRLPPQVPGQRYLVVISDLHLGLGQDNRGWRHKEDFRWPRALKGFLDSVSTCGKHAVDLVIAGDALELWQTSDNHLCKARGTNGGCSADEFRSRVKAAIAAHSGDLAALGHFADTGRNRVFVIPGNHDAALMLPAHWQMVHAAINSRRGRVSKVHSGTWHSDDGRVVIEHGHQIGSDVNAFTHWPDVIARPHGPIEYLEQSWGEEFVQAIFNKEEDDYQIIDNLSPESAGARYRMADRGVWGSAKDIARFLRFNLFETSVAQKIQVLGDQPDKNSPVQWDLDWARKREYRLFMDALPADDPFRVALAGNTPQARELQTELSELVRDKARFPDDELAALCTQAAIKAPDKFPCQKRTLNALTQSLLHSRYGVMKKHLQELVRKPELRRMRVYVYAHTHLLEDAWKVNVTDMQQVTVLNTGAFQRVIDEKNFLILAKNKGYATPAAALGGLTVNDLAPCYSAVAVALGPMVPEAKTLYWHMEEGKEGDFVSTTNADCQIKAVHSRR